MTVLSDFEKDRAYFSIFDQALQFTAPLAPIIISTHSWWGVGFSINNVLRLRIQGTNYHHNNMWLWVTY